MKKEKLNDRYPLTVVRSVVRRLRPSLKTINDLARKCLVIPRPRILIAIALLAASATTLTVAQMGQVTQPTATTSEPPDTTSSEQVIVDTDPNSLPFDDEDGKIAFGVTVYTDIKLNGMGGGLGAVVWECPPGHTPRTGGCTSKPPNPPVPGCLTWGLHFVDRHDNIVCNGAPHVFPNLTYWISGADGVPYLVQDWSPVWSGAQPWECFPRPTFTVRTTDVAIYPPCSPTPTPRPTATPTPRPTATPYPPQPCPSCAPGYHCCAPESPPNWPYPIPATCCPDIATTCGACWVPTGGNYYACCCTPNWCTSPLNNDGSLNTEGWLHQPKNKIYPTTHYVPRP